MKSGSTSVPLQVYMCDQPAGAHIRLLQGLPPLPLQPTAPSSQQRLLNSTAPLFKSHCGEQHGVAFFCWSCLEEGRCRLGSKQLLSTADNSEARLSNHDEGAGVGNSAEEDITKGEETMRADWQQRGTSWAGTGAEMRDQ